MKLDEISFMEKLQKLNMNEVMKVISTPFNTSGFIIMITVLYIYNILNINDIFFLGQGIFIGNLLKYIFKRPRPYIYTDKIKNLSGKEHKIITTVYSFPSGHTFAATFFSLLMLIKYPNEFLFNIIGILVGFSRIFLGVHYPTDIIGGILFAIIIFNILKQIYKII